MPWRGGKTMIEQDSLTYFIVFALFLNTIGFLFFALSLKKESKQTTENTYDKSYDLSMNEGYLKETEKIDEEDLYDFTSTENDEELTITPIKEKTYRFEREIDLPDIYEPVEKDLSEDNPYQFKYEPTYEEDVSAPEPMANAGSSYQPQYETEEDIENKWMDEPLTPINEVDYEEEMKPREENDDDSPRFDSEYRFKHAYSKEERYKYEYEDYKLVDQEETPKPEPEPFDYNIDIDKEHEKHYGGMDDPMQLSKYELYVQKMKQSEPSMQKSIKPVFHPTNMMDEVPETAIDREERQKEETIDIKQFEPRKYDPPVTASIEEDEIDDAEVDKRIEYLMGKMHDPTMSKNKNPLDEEF